MKFKSIYLLSAIALAAAGCGSAKKITATPLAITTPLTPKKAALTENEEKRWSHLDIFKDTIPGMSVDRAYNELLKDRKFTKIIVGVVDSGVDIEHPDLAPVVWTNTKEVAGNGIDDDKNGYIDDIHGWNFLGNAEHENLEFVRIVKKGDDGSAIFKKAKAEYDKEYRQAQAGKQRMDFIINTDLAIKKELNKEDYTADDLRNLKTSNQDIIDIRQNLIGIIERGLKNDFDNSIKEGKEHYENQLAYNLNLKFDGRKIVGDNPDDFNDRDYGDNNVIGPKKDGALHGTHVAGIIAQVRGNNIGGDGVANNNVEIMAVRAVPDGDEYDKDVALAIRYAVDNGAKVINGSFGKYFSPHSNWVHDAIKYAAEKDVLVVCAAGNEGTNLNRDGGIDRYPNDNINGKEISDNFLTIGALNPVYSENLVANFSNYGNEDVDIFSPGVQIYATAPDNSYRFLEGTSMASPNAAGVAALIRSYYPNLTAPEVKQIIMQSGVAIDLIVSMGEEKDEKTASFSTTSRTGKIVNAYNAIILADQMSRSKKK